MMTNRSHLIACLPHIEVGEFHIQQPFSSRMLCPTSTKYLSPCKYISILLKALVPLKHTFETYLKGQSGSRIEQEQAKSVSAITKERTQ